MANKDIENVQTLKQWILAHNVNSDKDLKEFGNLFYNLDLGMRKLHDNGYYVASFNINSILIQGDFVQFQGVNKFPFDNKEYFVHQNIYYLSCLAIGIYNDCLDYINPDNKEMLKTNFESFSEFIPSDVVPYYKGIIMRDSTVYLSDYIKSKVQIEIQKEQESLGGSFNSSNKSRGASTYTKSTLMGKLYSDREDNSNISAFIQIFLFPIIILLLAILIPIIIILNH